MLSYQLEGEAYRELGLDERARAWLEPVGLWLGVKTDPETRDDRLALFDPETGEEIADYTAISRARAQAEARARTEAQARVDAEARAAAEEQLRLAEAELRRLRKRES